FLVSVWNTNSLRLYKLSGPLCGESLTPMNNMPCVLTNDAWAAEDSPSGVLGQTNGPNIFAADHRFVAPAVQRNGHLFCAHHIFLDYTNVHRTAVQVWQIALPSCQPAWVGR